MTDSERTLVTVTGASGFIALHVVRDLLDAGYHVRGTIRSLARSDELIEALSKHTDRARDGRLTFVEADLLQDAGWDEAVAGATYVHHIASPLPSKPPKHEDDLIVPAREGTLRLLRAATAAGVDRVVMTSSVAAVIYGHARDGSEVYDESSWSKLGPNVAAYEKSKTLAERAAWDFMESLPDDSATELVTINPGLVLGPVLYERCGTSGEVVRKLMKREFPACPDVSWAMCDVRDVAAAHMAAMTTPEAAGKRFIIADETVSMLQVAGILDARFRDRGYKVPTRRLPNFVLRLVALFDKTARLAVPELGLRQDVSHARATEVLGYDPRPVEKSVVDMAESFIAHGIV